MRLLKRAHRVESPEDEAALTRLQAVTRRGKVEISRYPMRDSPVEIPMQQQLFRPTDKVRVEDDRD